VSATIIKPTKLVFNAAQRARVIQNTLTATAKAIKVDHDVTTQTWSNRPTFTIDTPTPYERTIATDDAIYAMLDAGTKAHTIKPRRGGGILKFTTPFRSKTLPNQIMSRAGSKGTASAIARVVHHPGTAPRKWAKTVAAKWQQQVGAIFQRALDAEAG
jgi:hypothetical protein